MTIQNLGLILEETIDQDEQTRRPTVPLAVAEKMLADCVDRKINDALAWHGSQMEGRMPAPHSAFKNTTGVGKSTVIRDGIAFFVPEAKLRKLPHRALYLVPTHRLGDEARGKMSAGIATALWQGRKANDVSTGEPLCRNHDAVDAALAIGADVEETACRKKSGDHTPNLLCPFYITCGYQAQKNAAKDADVVFAAHEMALQPPDILGEDLGLVIIDEGFWQKGIMSSSIVISGLALDLAAFPVRDNGGAIVNANDTDHLAEMLGRLEGALDGLPDGYVTKAAILESGLLPATRYEDGSCANAAKYEWRRKVDAGLRPDHDATARKKITDKCRFLGQIPRRAAMWRALDELLAGDADASGRLRIETKSTAEGSIRYLKVLGRKEVHEKIAGLPLIHADATMQIDLVRHYLPRIEMALDLDVETPHMRVAQVVGLKSGKKALEPGERTPRKEKEVSNRVKRLVNFVRHQIRGRKALIITYKDIEDEFRQIEGAEVAHFGAIEGIDRWKDAEVLFVIGRPLPGPKDIEEYVASFTGQPIVLGKDNNTERPEKGAGILMANGADRVLKVRAYQNPMAETVSRAVAEAAVVQAIGRVRGVRRGTDNPVEVFMILHDMVTPQVVDDVIEFQDEEPDRIDEMIIRGLVPQLPSDAAILFPDLFKNREVAKKAYQKAQLDVRGWGKTPNRNILLGKIPRPRLVRYQPTGKGQVPRLAIFSPELFPNIRATLETGAGLADGVQGLGPLASFEIIPAPEPEPAGPEPELWAPPPLAPDPEPGIRAGKVPEIKPGINVQANSMVWTEQGAIPVPGRDA